RPCDVEGRDSDLREAGGGGVPHVIAGSARQEHLVRKDAPEARAPVVRVLRGQERRRTPRLTTKDTKEDEGYEGTCSFAFPRLLFIKDLHARHGSDAGVAGVGDSDELRSELSRSGQRDRTRRTAALGRRPVGVPRNGAPRERAGGGARDLQA